MPTASFTYVRSGTLVTFTDTSSGLPDPIVSWSWDFDGIDTSNNQNPWFDFGGSGSFDVTLQVVDSGGVSSDITETITIGVLGTVGTLVACKLPPSLASSPCVEEFVKKWQHYLANQKEPELTGADIEDQNNWTQLENTLIAELAVYETIQSEGAKWMASGNLIFDPSSDTNTATKVIKTGPDEVEWWNNQENQTEFFEAVMKKDGALDQYKEFICNTSKRIGFYLPFCESKKLGNLFKKAGRPESTTSSYIETPSWLL